MSISVDDLTDEDWERGRLAVEDELIAFRDAGLMQFRANGLVVRWKDGTSSDIIRLSIVDALKTGLRAIEAGPA